MLIDSGAIIPAFNAGSTIETIVRETTKHVDKVIVVNDGSIDSTEKTLEKLFKQCNKVELLVHNTRRGKVQAFKSGLLRTLESWPSISNIVSLDADSAHNPKEIPLFFKKMKESSVDMVIGNRYVASPQAEHRSFIVNLSRLCISEFVSFSLDDPFCGYRSFTGKMGEIFKAQLSGFEYALEVEELIIAKNVGSVVDQLNLEHTIPQGSSTKWIEFKSIVDLLKSREHQLNLSYSQRRFLSEFQNSLQMKEDFIFETKISDKKLFIEFVYLPREDSYSLRSVEHGGSGSIIKIFQKKTLYKQKRDFANAN